MSLHAIRADLVQTAPEMCWRIIGEESGQEYTKGVIWNAPDGYTALVRYHKLILRAVDQAMREAEGVQLKRDLQALRSNDLVTRSATGDRT